MPQSLSKFEDHGRRLRRHRPESGYLAGWWRSNTSFIFVDGYRKPKKTLVV